MKLFSLSGHPNKPCYILQVKDVTLMLDCGLVTQTILNFLPLSLVPTSRLSHLSNFIPRNCPDPQVEGELKDCDGRVFVNSAPEFCPPLQKLIDFSEVDAILISNHSTMLALPYVTEGTGFHGVIYMTEPTLLIGKLYLEELVEFIERTPKPVLASHWKEVLHTLPQPLCDSVKPRNWQQIYSWNSVRSSLSKVQTLSYEEGVNVYGTLKIMPVDSGYCLGSSNWIIKSDYEKLVYVSGSSTLTAHPRPMKQDALKDADILFLTGLTQSPTANPDTTLSELCLSAAITLRNGGNVLIPCYPTGLVYDLFECLSNHLDNSALSHIPLYFISPVADLSLGYSNILVEWVSQVKQDKAFIPEEPFPHANLVKNGRLKPVKEIYDDGFCKEIRQPCIVFCGHPSLRFGDSVHFIELWGSNPLNTVIFTEPEYPHVDALAPFQPLAMKFVHCPIDTSLNYAQANKLLREIKPAKIVLPDSYPSFSAPGPYRPDIAIEKPTNTTEIYSIRRGEFLSLPIKRQKLSSTLSFDMSLNIKPQSIKPDCALGTVTGILEAKDNRYSIQTVDSSSDGQVKQKPENLQNDYKYEWGTLDVQKFIGSLYSIGIQDIKIEYLQKGYIIHMSEKNTLIQIDKHTTHIVCDATDKEFRHQLRNITVNCLKKF